MDCFETLQRRLAFLKHYKQGFERLLGDGGEDRAPEAVMLLRGLSLGRRCVDAAIAIHLSRCQGAGFLSCNTLRPFYETSIRLLWATRGDGHWPRLQADYANEDLKWARHAKDIPDFKGHAEEILRSRSVAEVKGLPKVKDLLGDIHKCEPQMLPCCVAYHYSLYSLLCRASHGHLGAVGSASKGGWGTLAKQVCIYSTYFMCCAVCIVSYESVEEIEKERDRILEKLVGEA